MWRTINNGGHGEAATTQSQLVKRVEKNFES